jgi:hypothetical protein
MSSRTRGGYTYLTLKTIVVDYWSTDGGVIVSLAPQEDSWYSFLLDVESMPGLYRRWKD